MKYPLFLSDFNKNSNFLARFLKNLQISNFIKIRPVGDGLFHAGRQTDRRANMTKLKVTFRNIAIEPKNDTSALGLRLQ